MQHESAPRFAAMLAALSQPTRLRIVDVVAAGGPKGTPAGEVARAVECPASTLSFHLKELAQAGLLHATPQGRYIRYSVERSAFATLADFVAGLPGADPSSAEGGRARSRRGAAKGRKAKKTAGRTSAGQLSIFDE